MGKEVVRDAGSVSWLSGQTGPAGTGRRKANVISAAGEEGMGWGGMGVVLAGVGRGDKDVTTAPPLLELNPGAPSGWGTDMNAL